MAEAATRAVGNPCLLLLKWKGVGQEVGAAEESWRPCTTPKEGAGEGEETLAEEEKKGRGRNLEQLRREAHWICLQRMPRSVAVGPPTAWFLLVTNWVARRCFRHSQMLGGAQAAAASLARADYWWTRMSKGDHSEQKRKKTAEGMVVRAKWFGSQSWTDGREKVGTESQPWNWKGVVERSWKGVAEKMVEVEDCQKQTPEAGGAVEAKESHSVTPWAMGPAWAAAAMMSAAAEAAREAANPVEMKPEVTGGCRLLKGRGQMWAGPGMVSGVWMGALPEVGAETAAVAEKEGKGAAWEQDGSLNLGSWSLDFHLKLRNRENSCFLILIHVLN